MAASQFTKRKVKLFVFILVLVAVLSAAAAIGLHFYIGHKFDAADLNENLDDKLKLGSSFTVDEILESEKYTYSWIKSSDIDVKIFALSSDEDEEYAENNGILSYSSAENSFTVIGVAKGKILFSNAVDSSINLEIPFQTKFSSEDTSSIITSINNYPSLLDDGILTSEEIEGIKKLQIYDAQTVDFADFTFLTSLEKLEILHDSTYATEGVLNVKNLNLPSQTNIYVTQANYLNYIKASSDWTAFGDRIFIITEEDNLASIILNKNGGTIIDDNGLIFENVGVAIGGTLALSDMYVISRVGYTFTGWTAIVNGTETIITDDYIFIDDLKLSAQWQPYTYTLKLHHNNGTDAVTNNVMTYDKTEPILSASDLPSYNGYSQIGWAYDSTSTNADFEINENITNLAADKNAEIHLYAVWANNVFTIEYYNGSDYFDKITGQYGHEVQLIARNTPYDPTADFVGWAYSNDAMRPDYQYGETVEGLYATPNTNGIIRLYAVFEAAFYTINYSVGDATPLPSSQANLPRGQAVTLHEAVTRTGYKFKGWQDDGGIIYTPFEDYYKQDISKRILITNYYLNTGIVTTKSSVTLTPVWEANTFNVNFNGNGASSIYSSTIVTFGVEKSFIGSVSKTGNTLSKLTSNVGNVSITGRTLSVANIQTIYLALRGSTSDNNFDSTQTVTFTASWSVNSYKLSITQSNVTITVKNSSGTKVSAGQVPYGTTLIVTFSTNSGYHDGWCKVNGTTISSGYQFNMPANDSGVSITSGATKDACIALGSLIYLADGSVTAVENLRLGDEVMVFNHETGKLDVSNIIYLDQHGFDYYYVMTLNFEDNVSVKFIFEHGLFDSDLNEYVMINENNIDSYVGHTFFYSEYNGETFLGRKLKLLNYQIEEEYTAAFSFTTAVHYNHFVDGMLCMPAGIDGIYNIFTLDSEMKYDTELMLADIEKYGLTPYEEWAEYLSYEEFVMFNGQYVSIIVGKGKITVEEIIDMLVLYGWGN